MINEAQVFLAGYVATEPTCRTTTRGKPEAHIRVGYTPRRMDRETGEWADGPTSFVSVKCWGKLADNVAVCLRKGEPVVVMGRIQVRPYEKDGAQRLSVDVYATSIGYDLARGSPGLPGRGPRPARRRPSGRALACPRPILAARTTTTWRPEPRWARLRTPTAAVSSTTARSPPWLSRVMVRRRRVPRRSDAARCRLVRAGQPAGQPARAVRASSSGQPARAVRASPRGACRSVRCPVVRGAAVMHLTLKHARVHLSDACRADGARRQGHPG